MSENPMVLNSTQADKAAYLPVVDVNIYRFASISMD